MVASVRRCSAATLIAALVGLACLAGGVGIGRADEGGGRRGASAGARHVRIAATGDLLLHIKVVQTAREYVLTAAAEEGGA